MRLSKITRKYPQKYDPGFGAAREWKSYAVSSLVYMIKDGDYDRNIDIENILSLLDDWYAEDFINDPST